VKLFGTKAVPSNPMRKPLIGFPEPQVTKKLVNDPPPKAAPLLIENPTIFAPVTLTDILYIFDPEFVPVDVPDPNIKLLGEPEAQVNRTPFIAVFF